MFNQTEALIAADKKQSLPSAIPDNIQLADRNASDEGNKDRRTEADIILLNPTPPELIREDKSAEEHNNTNQSASPMPEIKDYHDLLHVMRRSSKTDNFALAKRLGARFFEFYSSSYSQEKILKLLPESEEVNSFFVQSKLLHKTFESIHVLIKTVKYLPNKIRFQLFHDHNFALIKDDRDLRLLMQLFSKDENFILIKNLGKRFSEIYSKGICQDDILKLLPESEEVNSFFVQCRLLDKKFECAGDLIDAIKCLPRNIQLQLIEDHHLALINDSLELYCLMKLFTKDENFILIKRFGKRFSEIYLKLGYQDDILKLLPESDEVKSFIKAHGHTSSNASATSTMRP